MLHKKNATLADFAKFDFYQIKLNMISKLMCWTLFFMFTLLDWNILANTWTLLYCCLH